MVQVSEEEIIVTMFPLLLVLFVTVSFIILITVHPCDVVLVHGDLFFVLVVIVHIVLRTGVYHAFCGVIGMHDKVTWQCGCRLTKYHFRIRDWHDQSNPTISESPEPPEPPGTDWNYRKCRNPQFQTRQSPYRHYYTIHSTLFHSFPLKYECAFTT